VIRATFGVVVEGAYDVGVFEELIPKIRPATAWAMEGRGRSRLMSRFPNLLRMFEYRTMSAGPVDRALVIRDSNGKDPTLVEAEMRAKIAGLTYGFPRGVEVHAVQQETETWLLADPRAISQVAGRDARAVRGPLEQRHHAKEALMDVLTEVKLSYTPEVCRRIARAIDLPTLRTACPAFVLFEQKVHFTPLGIGG